jgi:hypothetical protein
MLITQLIPPQITREFGTLKQGVLYLCNLTAFVSYRAKVLPVVWLEISVLCVRTFSFKTSRNSGQQQGTVNIV